TQLHFALVGDVEVPPELVQAGSGTIDPTSGAASLSLLLRLHFMNPFFPSDCGIGLTLNLTTGASGTLRGTPYDRTTGTATFVENSFAVPASDHCGFFAQMVDLVFTLPSPAGNNTAILNATLQEDSTDDILCGCNPKRPPVDNKFMRFAPPEYPLSVEVIAEYTGGPNWEMLFGLDHAPSQNYRHLLLPGNSIIPRSDEGGYDVW